MATDGMIQLLILVTTRAKTIDVLFQIMLLLAAVRRVACEAISGYRMNGLGIIDLRLFVGMAGVAYSRNGFLHNDGMFLDRPAMTGAAFLHLDG